MSSECRCAQPWIRSPRLQYNTLLWTRQPGRCCDDIIWSCTRSATRVAWMRRACSRWRTSASMATWVRVRVRVGVEVGVRLRVAAYLWLG